MRAVLSLLAAASTLVLQAAAHGFVPQLRVGSAYVEGWNVNTDPYKTPQPSRVVRATKPDSGFISDVTSGDITCSVGNSALPPTPTTASLAAGEKVQVLWNTWPLGHFGPVMNYMAKCDVAGCSSFKGDTGSPWFKISQQTFSNGTWASDVVATSNFTSTVSIPSNLEAGDYLLRHEILALHGGGSIGGAQFYPVCIQLTVTGGGSLAPTGGVGFPGTYNATDPGILFSPYQGTAVNEAYVAPGGDIYPGLTF